MKEKKYYSIIREKQGKEEKLGHNKQGVFKWGEIPEDAGAGGGEKTMIILQNLFRMRPQSTRIRRAAPSLLLL